MNLAPELAEAYTYVEMFNRKYDGGSDFSDKIFTAGFPVENLMTNALNVGGASEHGPLASEHGPLEDKVIPAGLVLDRRRNKRGIEYESHLEEGSSGTISDELFDRLFDAISPVRKTSRNGTSKLRKHESTSSKKNLKFKKT